MGAVADQHPAGNGNLGHQLEAVHIIGQQHVLALAAIDLGPDGLGNIEILAQRIEGEAVLAIHIDHAPHLAAVAVEDTGTICSPAPIDKHPMRAHRIECADTGHLGLRNRYGAGGGDFLDRRGNAIGLRSYRLCAASREKDRKSQQAPTMTAALAFHYPSTYLDCSNHVETTSLAGLRSILRG